VVTAVNEKNDPLSPVYKSGRQSEDNPLEFILSDESVDRMGDSIKASGWQLDEFKRSPIALYGHDHNQPIGVWKNVRVIGKQLRGELKLAKQGTSDFIDTIRSLIDQGVLKAVSVGFQPLESEPRKSGGFDFIKSALHEVSICAVGANPNAMALAKAFSPEVANKLFVQLDITEGDDRSGQSTSTPTPNLEAARTRLKAMGIDY